jgi:hypothetical protein
MPKKYPKGHYNPNVEVRVKKTARKGRAVILTIFLPREKVQTSTLSLKLHSRKSHRSAARSDPAA